MREIRGGVTAPRGFFAAAAAAGIKEKDRLDMAMLYSETPCSVACAFTRNVARAAPVLWDEQILEGGRGAQAVVINAGFANACTGRAGLEDCRETAAVAGGFVGLCERRVLLASTGVIGPPLPMDRIRAGIEQMVPFLGGDPESGSEAARAILTTDTHEKEVAVQFEAGKKTVTLGGMCKGSGMIHPNMGTMLSFLTTDLAISADLLAEALREDVESTYNMVSVDGDTSTNDTAMLLANGLAQNEEITERDEDYRAFCAALRLADTALAKMIAGDGEGATSLLEVKVTHASSVGEARMLAKSVVSSSLTKAMLFGNDANFGRVLCALGYSGVSFDPEGVSLSFESALGKLPVFARGKMLPYSEGRAEKILAEPEVTILADMGMGDASATAWGCDLSPGYVEINADYRS